MRDLAPAPIFVNSDGSWADEIAGLAYESGAIGKGHGTVHCDSNTAGELLALLLAMQAAAGHAKVTFRVDCSTAAQPHRQRAQRRAAPGELAGLRQQLVQRLEGHSGWRVVRIPRSENVVANRLARRARSASTRPGAMLDADAAREAC